MKLAKIIEAEEEKKMRALIGCQNLLIDLEIMRLNEESRLTR
jgi:hypothetical protein